MLTVLPDSQLVTNTEGPVILGRICPTYIAVYNNILSGGEIKSPAENLSLTGMYLQQSIRPSVTDMSGPLHNM